MLPGLSWQGSLGEMACLGFTERPVSKNRGAVEEVTVISWTPPTHPYPNAYTFEGEAAAARAGHFLFASFPLPRDLWVHLTEGTPSSLSCLFCSAA